MRDLKGYFENFVPQHEKQYSAQLFIDSAVKNAIEVELETMARALTGTERIEWDFEKGVTRSIEGGVIVEVGYAATAKIGAQVFRGRSKAIVLLRIIEYWIGGARFPCGAAQSINQEK
jgi:hypothetical protein